MAEPRVIGIKSVDLGVTDLAANEKFYVDIWGLERVGDQGGSVYLRGTGDEHHIVALHPGPRTELLNVDFAAAGKQDVDALHARAKGRGITELDDPGPLAEPGGGYGFSFKDGDSRVLRVVAARDRRSDVDDVADRPRKLSHVVFNSAEVERCTEFFVDLLGFKVSDKTRMMNFVRCNADHHSVAFAHAGGSTLNHIAFEMPDLESVMRGAGRVRGEGFPIEWGVGRHGPGNNVFAYFVGPEDVVIEYTGEVDQVDDSYREGGPDDWGFPAGRSDRWGVSNPPSKRIKEAQQRLAFAEALFHPEG